MPFKVAAVFYLLAFLTSFLLGNPILSTLVMLADFIPVTFVYLWSNLQAEELKGKHKITRLTRNESVYQQTDQLDLLIRTLPNIVAKSSQDLISQALNDAKKMREVLPVDKKDDLAQIIYNQVAAGFLMKELDEYLSTRAQMFKGLNAQQQAIQEGLSADVRQAKVNLVEHIQKISLLLSALRANVLIKQEKELTNGQSIEAYFASLEAKSQEIEVANDKTKELLQGI